MIGGISTSEGIVFYNTKKSGENAVFCYFDGDGEAFETGEKSALIEKMTAAKKTKTYDSKSRSVKNFFTAFFIAAAFVAAVWVFVGGFFAVFGAFLFAAAGFFPIMMFVILADNGYREKKDLLQFRRFHGAEHTLINFHNEDPSLSDFEKAKTFSPYSTECGTAYGGTLFFFAAVLGTSFALIPKIGFLWFLGINVFTVILLFINFFNPKSPFLILQKAVVEKPTEKELHLAYNGFKKLIE